MSEEWRRNPKARTQRQIAALLLQPAQLPLRKEFKKPRLCEAFLDYCAGRVTQDSANGKRLASLAVRLSHCFPDDCLRVRAFGLLGSWHRAFGPLEKSDIILRIASKKACHRCLADLKRRIAHLRSAQERYSDALEEVKGAIELYKERNDTDGLGKALLCRGTILYYSGDISNAVFDFSEALTLISLEKSTFYYRACIFNLTTALAVGKMVDAETALKKLKKVTPLFKGLRGFSAERAKLRWLEGLIMMQLGCDQRAEGLLRTARAALIELKMPQEVAAITADLALFCHTDRRAVRSLARETVKLDWAATHKDIGPKIVAFAQETTVKDVSAAQLLAAAKSLRQGVGDCGIAAPGFA